MHFSVRQAREQEIAALADIEVEARTRFADSEMSEGLRGYRTPEKELLACQNEGLLWVADLLNQGLAAFLAAESIERGLHVLQMSVRLSAGRRGIGTRLLSEVSQEAKNRGLGHVSLTTFAHVPWNAPAYSRRGFVVLQPNVLSPALRERLSNERAAGLSNRVAMRKSAA